MASVIILGNGPAGISTAIYTIRGGIKTTVIGRDGGSLEKADLIENYYGFPEPIPAKELIQNGISQAKRLGVAIIEDEVFGLSYDGGFAVYAKSGEYKADSLVLATGASREKPQLKGLDAFEGKGVSYCAVCDAFFYRNKPVAVLGSGEYALHEAEELKPVASCVTILTNGMEPKVEFPPDIAVIKQKIESLEGEPALEAVRFADGPALLVKGLFIAYGVAGSTDLAKKLGVLTEGTKIAVDENMATNIPGLFAAGDCVKGMMQISKAVYDGSAAGFSVIRYLRAKK